MTLTKAERDRLRGLLAKATPGPWRMWDSYTQASGITATKWVGSDDAEVFRAGVPNVDIEGKHEDFELMVAAVNALPDLLDDLDEADRKG